MRWFDLLRDLDDGAIAMRLARRGKMARPPPLDTGRETLESKKERIYEFLCDQYEPIDARRVACELGLSKPATNTALKALLVEGRVDVIGKQHVRQGPPTRLFVAL